MVLLFTYPQMQIIAISMSNLFFKSSSAIQLNETLQQQVPQINCMLYSNILWACYADSLTFNVSILPLLYLEKGYYKPSRLIITQHAVSNPSFWCKKEVVTSPFMVLQHS